MKLVRRYTAGEGLSDGDAVYISGSQTVSKATSSVRSKQIGIADNSALSGEPVDVVVYGPKDVVADGAVSPGDLVTAAATAGRVVSGSGFALGKAEQSASGAGSTLSIFVTLSEGLLRDITANDASPGLAVRQQGSAPGLRSRAPQNQPFVEMVRESDGVVVGTIYQSGSAVFIETLAGLNLRLQPAPNCAVTLGGNPVNMQGGYIDYCATMYGQAGAGLYLRPQPEAADAPVTAQSRNGANSAWLDRLKVHSYADVARIEVLNAALNLPAATHATPAEGDLRWNATSHKLQVYSGSAWETVTSA